MRAAKVPSNIAVTAKGVHYVVSTVNACVSCRAFQQSTPARDASSPPSPFRFTSLVPADWSALLRMCRRLTHPAASFNFASPGDTAQHCDSSLSSANTQVSTDRTPEAPTFSNHAYMHVVERVVGDFSPNNMIYHQLQKFHLVAAESTGQAQDSASSSMTAFTQLVMNLQQQPPQSPQEVSAELLNEADTALAAATPQEKRLLDPLANNEEAAAKSTANMDQLRAYAEASTQILPSAADAVSPSPPYTFTFFPYPVSAALSIPYCSSHFCVMVNLKPIVPYHLMVVPIRCVGTIHGLTEEEVEDWGHVMRCTIDVLEDLRRQQGAQKSESSSPSSVGNYSIAIQQGALAGQTVEHLHVHVIPFDPRGKLAGEPETDEEEQRRRPPRTPAVMKSETDALRPLFAKHTAAAAVAASKKK